MMEKLVTVTNSKLAAMRARRYRLTIANINSKDTNVIETFEAFVAEAASQKSRFVVIVDSASYNLFRICSNYPRKAVWLIVAIGHHNDFENIRSYVCPSGNVMFVEKLPLTREQGLRLASGIRTAANQCSF